MDRIGDCKAPLKEAVAALAACEGAPATIQPGAVVKMAEALEEVRYIGLDDIERRIVEDALTAYYGESKQ